MTLSYWDTQYQISAILPGFEDHLADMTRKSQTIGLDVERHAYGPDPRQYFDMHGRPTGLCPVFIHGGYWRALTADMHRFVLPPMAAAGGGVANVEYRLLPHVSLAEIVGDVLAALRQVSALTGQRLVVVGHSAGGHLAAIAALRLGDMVAACLPISGLFDLTPLPHTFLGRDVGLTPRDIQGLSPQSLFSGTSGRHLCAAVGRDETPEFHRQAQAFATAHGARVLTVPGADHMTVLNHLAQADGVLAQELDRMLSQHQ